MITLPATIGQRLGELRGILRSPTMENRILERLYALDRRPEVVDDVLAAWCKERNVSQVQAIIEAAFAVNLISQPEYHCLLRDTKLSHVPNAGKPRLDRTNGRLYFGGNLLCTFRVTPDQPTKIWKILESFDSNSWATEINNPLGPFDDLTAKIRDLNGRQKAIRFHQQGSRIWWEPTGA